MKIRASAAGTNALPTGNTFVAVDDLENRLGSSEARPMLTGELAPERPFEIKISAEGDPAARAQLLGAAFTRAMVLARESGLNARIYAECAVGDEEEAELYRSLGLIDDDGLIRMRRKAVAGPSVVRLPDGCSTVSDRLEDAQERFFFLERQRRLFMRENPEAWLDEIVRKPLMKRFLLVSREGLCGELICWAENQSTGVIGMAYTAPAWRRKGVAGYLMESARQYFYQCRVQEIVADVRMRMTPAVRLVSAAGYRQSEVLARYPGANLDAPSR